jgi:hypothetical protein
MSTTRHHITASYSGHSSSFGDFDLEVRITFTFALSYAAVAHPVNPRSREPDEKIAFVTAEIDHGGGRFERPDEPIGGNLAGKHLDDWASDWLADHEDEAREIAHSDRIAEEEAREDRAANGQFGVGA